MLVLGPLVAPLDLDLELGDLAVARNPLHALERLVARVREGRVGVVRGVDDALDRRRGRLDEEEAVLLGTGLVAVVGGHFPVDDPLAGGRVAPRGALDVAAVSAGGGSEERNTGEADEPFLLVLIRDLR
ncbi:hypothetical protein [Actinoplanes sp. M2I2]|uniref:hypothetical protein n=1 Tax=Actinoplanes sp. M2I2 TaxID=1734444 RepID=UPI0020210258|nr:hypothetical protein [Actinoplanes sp. M2I2]